LNILRVKNSLIRERYTRFNIINKFKLIKTLTTSVNKLTDTSDLLNSSRKRAKYNLAISSCTSLVVYGSNLGTTLGMGRFPKDISKLIYLTPISYSVVVGILLSDGWLERGSLTSNTRFVFK